MLCGQVFNDLTPLKKYIEFEIQCMSPFENAPHLMFSRKEAEGDWGKETLPSIHRIKSGSETFPGCVSWPHSSCCDTCCCCHSSDKRINAALSAAACLTLKTSFQGLPAQSQLKPG